MRTWKNVLKGIWEKSTDIPIKDEETEFNELKCGRLL